MSHLLTLEAELVELTAQIHALDEEIAPLQATHDAMFKKIAQFETDNKHRNLSRPPAPRRLSPHPDDPPLISYEYFDESIRHYFSQDSKPEALEPSVEKILHRIDTKLEAAHNALVELIWRMGGVSAFPINNRLYDESADALLGLRFDVLNHRTLQYLQPHYIILRRRKDKAENSVWLVFRHTTPMYMPLQTYAELLPQNKLDQFVERVRAFLVKTQYKHDKFDALASVTYADVFGQGEETVVSTMEKDLECRRVLLHIENHHAGRKQLNTIELICNISGIEKVSCKFGEPGQRIFMETELATCSLTRLEHGFGVVVKYMRLHGLL